MTEELGPNPAHKQNEVTTNSSGDTLKPGSPQSQSRIARELTLGRLKAAGFIGLALAVAAIIWNDPENLTKYLRIILMPHRSGQAIRELGRSWQEQQKGDRKPTDGARPIPRNPSSQQPRTSNTSSPSRQMPFMSRPHPRDFRGWIQPPGPHGNSRLSPPAGNYDFREYLAQQKLSADAEPRSLVAPQKSNGLTALRGGPSKATNADSVGSNPKDKLRSRLALSAAVTQALDGLAKDDCVGAIEPAKQALVLSRELYGTESIAAARSLRLMYVVRSRTGDFTESDKLLAELLAVNEKLLPALMAQVTTADWAAVLECERKPYAEIQRISETDGKISLSASLGASSAAWELTRIAGDCFMTSILHTTNDNLSQAKMFIDRAISIASTRAPSLNPVVARYQLVLAAILEAQGKAVECDKTLDEAIETIAAFSGRDCFLMGLAMCLKGEVLTGREDWAGAGLAFEESLRAHQASGTADTAENLDALLSIAFLRYFEHDFEDASKYMSQCAEAAKTHAGWSGSQGLEELRSRMAWHGERDWKSAGSDFSQRGRLVHYDDEDGTVLITSGEGLSSLIEYSRLSAVDQSFVQSYVAEMERLEPEEKEGR